MNKKEIEKLERIHGKIYKIVCQLEKIVIKDNDNEILKTSSCLLKYGLKLFTDYIQAIPIQHLQH